MSAQLRDVTPPPRSRSGAVQGDLARQQLGWSAEPGSKDWTSSPLTRPKDPYDMIDAKEKGLLSPQATSQRDCLLPLKVNEDSCFSSPKPARGQTPGSASGDSVVEGLFTSPSPQVGSAGKENWQPVQGLRTGTPRTPMKTPSRLPTVKENDAQMPTLDEGETNPAWVVQSPEPVGFGDSIEELGMAMKGLGLSPVPPGLEDVRCELPKHQVKGTFIQFVSPLKTFALNSPPKTEPVNFAPSTSAAASLFSQPFGEPHDDGLAMSHSPSPWFTHEQIPFFPRTNAMPAAPPPPLGAPGGELTKRLWSRWSEEELTTDTEPKQKGPVVRLAEFLPEPGPSQPMPQQDVQSEALCWAGMPMMHGSDSANAGYGSIDATASMWQMQAPEQMQPQMQQQHFQPQMQQQMQPQQFDPQMQQQAQPQMQLNELQQMQAQLQQMQLQQMQMQQMQMQTSQMQPPQLQQPTSQMQLPMAPPQGQTPQLQPPQMQPPLTPAMGQMQTPQMQLPQSQPDNMFLQQLLQLQMQPQMQPPSWPPMQPPTSIAGEQVPAPPLQMAMESAAPSVLCPSTCHQVGVCHCGEVKVGDCLAPVPSAASSHEQQQQQQQMPNCILLSAAMFPEMGTSAGAENAGRQ